MAKKEFTAGDMVSYRGDLGILLENTPTSSRSSKKIWWVKWVIPYEANDRTVTQDEVYEKDALYGSTLDDNVMSGYLVWGKPLAALMSKSRIVTTIVGYPALKWANHMAGNHNWFGSFALKVGIPICRLINRMSRLIQRQELSTNQSLHSEGLS